MRIVGTEANTIGIQNQPKTVERPAENQNGGAERAEKVVNTLRYSNMPEFEKQMLPASEKVVIEAIEKANKAIEGARTTFEFSIHEGTHQIMVKVINKDTGELIREIPPEKILDLVAKMWEIAGLFIDERR